MAQIRLNVSALPTAASATEFRLHQSAVEWSLCEPIVIADENDIRSRVNWRERLHPFHHQIQNLITFCRRLPVSIIADDVGLGKTISAGLILSELLIRRRVNRALVVCTKLIGPQWIEELENKFGIDGVFVSGRDASRIFSSDRTVVATTYDTLRVHIEHARNAGFEMLILDEAHKLRNLYGTATPPQTAIRIRELLVDRVFKYVLMLTATPMQNRIHDLYSLVDCLAAAKGHRNPFGDLTSFNARFAFGERSRGWAHTRPGIEFRSILRQYLVRTRREVARLHFPARLVYLRRVQQSPQDCEILQIVRDEVSAQRLAAANILRHLGMAMMSSPQALLQSLESHGAGGAGASQAVSRLRALIQQCPVPSKMQALMQIVEELRQQRPQDWRMVIFTSRIPTLEMIVNHLKQQGISTGVIRGHDPRSNQAAIRSYSATPPECHVIVSTDAGAEGLNLQKGNVVVNYDLPWNPMTIEQRIGRVQRLGSDHENVLIFSLAVEDSPEDLVVARLLTKLIQISESVGDIESILEASEEYEKRDFESQIAQMVQQSLRGVDVLLQRQKAEDSISRARALLARQQDELNQRLGDLSELHGTGVRPPDLSVQVPQQPISQFVAEALRYAGHTVVEAPHYGEGVLQVHYIGRRAPTLVTFNRDLSRQLKQHYMGTTVELYHPGQQVYERLLETWRNRAACKLHSASKQTEALARSMIRDYVLQMHGAEITAAKLGNRQTHFAGSLKVLARASNGVDRYEKLIDVPVKPPEHPVIDAGMLQTAELEGGELSPGEEPLVPEQIQHAVQEDRDLSLFQSFYRSRLQEELPRAGQEPHLQKKVIDDFTISLEADIRSAEGLVYETCTVKLELRIHGHEGYQVTLKLLPATGQRLDEPNIWEPCDVSGHEYPSDFLENCQYSTKRVLQHLLVVSDESGRRVLPEYLQICGRTGRAAVVDEFAESSFSGVRVIRSALIRSPIAGRLYLEDELERCAFSDALVGRDEVLVSDVSHRFFRSDEQVQSFTSGRLCHTSESVACGFSDRRLLPDECVQSALSGRTMHRSESLPSDQSGRIGHLSEVFRCPETQQYMLRDEGAECAVSNRFVSRTALSECCITGREATTRLLVRCEFTDRLSLPTRSVISQESGRRLLDDQAVASDETGRIGHVSELVACEYSGKRLFPSEVVTCAISGRICAPSTCEVSALSDVCALSRYFGRCEYTQSCVLQTELRASDVTGFLFRIDQSATSQESGRVGHQSESVTCGLTGQQVLLDETVLTISGYRCLLRLTDVCVISGAVELKCWLRRSEFTGRCCQSQLMRLSRSSGLVLCPDEGGASEYSGRIAHVSELRVCAESRLRILQSEGVECVISGQFVLRQRCEKSAESGAWASRSRMVRCEYTGEWLLPTETHTSAVTGKAFRASQRVTSGISGRVGHLSESMNCEISQVLMLQDEFGKCAVSGIVCDLSLLLTCAVTGKQVLERHTRKSDFSQLRAIADKTLVSDVSQRRMLITESLTSRLSGKVAHSSEIVRCQCSGVVLLPEETTECSITGKRVASNLCAKSAVSGRSALAVHLATCEITNVPAFPEELTRSAASGLWFRSDKSAVSEESGAVGHKSELVRCHFSGRLLLRTELTRSDFSGQWMSKREAQQSQVSGRTAHQSEFVTCEVSGRQLLRDEAGWCDVSGRLVDGNLLVSCPLSGVRALKTELVRCEVTNRYLHAEESVVTPVFQKRVGRDLLVASDFTGRLALPAELQFCELTGHWGLPDEGVECADTGLWMDPRAAQQCSITGEFYRPGICISSETSQHLVHPSKARRHGLTQKLLHPADARVCQWYGCFFNNTETTQCVRTQLYFQTKLINPAGVVLPFAELMRRECDGTVRADLLEELQQLEPRRLMRLHALYVRTRSPRSKNLFCRAHISSRFRLQLYFVGFVLRIHSDGIRIVSPMTRELSDGAWAEWTG